MGRHIIQKWNGRKQTTACSEAQPAIQLTLQKIPLFWCIYSCDITYKATRRLSANLVSVSKAFKEEDIIYKLQEVSDEIRLLRTDFTAARFFVINRKIAISLLSAVATYFLVIQQTIFPREVI
ncbi:unnamed protein product [Ceutorhynchus assimilis]|uniref:Gustatory receptor n=1 Tax=Ceutorhynchus assimilis TaxID=467358 RepID=A0A9N9MVA7_9CUCU|nr:unnamed protein product [Ceutorhynchus assimilis]